jgi:hypothetical protein
LENGIVKIPALVDDYSIATGAETYQHWFDRIMETVRHKSFVAIGLHDCYSECWLDNYFDLLESLKSSGKLWTCDQVLNHTYLNEAFSDLH